MTYIWLEKNKQVMSHPQHFHVKTDFLLHSAGSTTDDQEHFASLWDKAEDKLQESHQR